ELSPPATGGLGIGTCDKGLPAMMMALAGARDLATVLVPGGVTLPPAHGEDAARIQTVGGRSGEGGAPCRTLWVRRRSAGGRADARSGRRSRLPHVRVPRRRLPVPRHRGNGARGRRRARPLARAPRAGRVRTGALA